MDIVFKCPHCQTELEVDSEAAGESISCPACNREISIPTASAPPTSTPARPSPPPPPPAPPRPAAPAPQPPSTPGEKKFAVPVSNKPVAPLIQKALPSLDAQAKVDGKKMLRLRTIRHSDCKEVGHDNFDAHVTEFLNQVGEENIVSISTVNYSYVEMGSQKIVTDFGVAVIYRG
jgi:DNA-directed RNA polymerase subunit RPC12/RpoP